MRQNGFLSNEIGSAYDKLRYLKEEITAEKIRAKVKGDENGKTLKDLIKYHFD